MIANKGSGGKSFYNITNKDIYEKLIEIDRKMSKISVKASVNSGLIALITLVLIAIISKVL